MDKYIGGLSTYPRYGTQTVEVLLQWGEYKGTIIHRINGDVIGADAIDYVLDIILSISRDFYPDMHIEQNQKHIEAHNTGEEAGLVRCYRLHNESGDELQIDSFDVADCIVGVRIVDWEADDIGN